MCVFKWWRKFSTKKVDVRSAASFLRALGIKNLFYIDSDCYDIDVALEEFDKCLNAERVYLDILRRSVVTCTRGFGGDDWVYCYSVRGIHPQVTGLDGLKYALKRFWRAKEPGGFPTIVVQVGENHEEEIPLPQICDRLGLRHNGLGK